MVATVGSRMGFSLLSLELRIRYGFESGENESVEIDQNMLGGDLGLFKFFDLRSFSPGLGLRVGGDWVQQKFVSLGNAPTRSSGVGRAGLVGNIGYALNPKLSIYLEAGANFFLLKNYVGADESSELALRVMPFGSVGLSATVY